MPPRGRPPGRKNGASLGAQPQSPAASLKTPNGTPQSTKGKKGKFGRPAKGMSRSQSAFAPVIRVASPSPSPPPAPAAAEPVAAEPVEPVADTPAANADPTISDNESEVPTPTDVHVSEYPNGTWNGSGKKPGEPSEVRIVGDITTVDEDVLPSPRPLSPAPVPGPRPRGRPPNSANRNGPRNSALTYSSSSVDLDEITYRQMGQDIDAYKIDLNFCESQLAMGDDLTPQECRVLQLRVLDLHHQIRFCEQRRETLDAQRVLRNARPFKTNAASGHRMSLPATSTTNGHPRGHTSGYASGRRSLPGPASTKRPLSSSSIDQNGSGPTNKRARAVSEVSIQDTISVHSQENGEVGDVSMAVTEGPSDIEMVHYNGNNRTSTPERSLFANAESGNHPGMKMQRLGLWYCQLCISEKYLYAGPDRIPSNPSKEIKDMGKLMTHYFDMHREHEPEERCAALGEALQKNRGPFAYWLIKSRSQRIEDPQVLDDAIAELKAGRVPKLLRDLCRAAAAFPGTTSD